MIWSPQFYTSLWNICQLDRMMGRQRVILDPNCLDLNPGLPSLAGDLGTMLGFSETKLHHPKTRVNK